MGWPRLNGDLLLVYEKAVSESGRKGFPLGGNLLNMEPKGPQYDYSPVRLPKHLRHCGGFVLRCFGCGRVAEIGEKAVSSNGDDPRYLCKYCGYRSVRLLLKGLDLGG